MPVYRVQFATTINVTVTIAALDEEDADERAWETAQGYLETIGGNYRDVIAEVTLDGIGAHTIREVTGSSVQAVDG